jgi:hypothetical protein
MEDVRMGKMARYDFSASGIAALVALGSKAFELFFRVSEDLGEVGCRMLC